MATKAHCAFCFECLSASFEHRQPLSLAEVEDLWGKYHASKSNDGKVTAAELDDDDDDEQNEEDDSEMTDVEPETPSTSSSARPAAISRLLNHEKSSAASSSSSLPSNGSASGSGSASSSSKATSESPSGSSTPASSNTSLRSRLSAATKRRKRSVGADGDEEQYPLFVTWNTVSRSGGGGHGGKSLRGCIGTFEAQGLESGLRSYALTSAFEDVRFQPIPSSLLPRLSAHVTLLTNFTSPTPDPYAWTLGKHGIRISFTHRGRRLGATYLPDVAREQGWTVDETLASLMRKAGWSGSGDWRRVWREGKGELVTYEGAQCGLDFEEWRVWREWVVGLGVERENLN